MSRIVSIEFFQQPPVQAAVTSGELTPQTGGNWVRTYEYPQGLLAVGAALTSLGKAARPLMNGVAALAHRVKTSLYDGLVGTLEVTGCIPSGKAVFGLVGETLSQFKVRHIHERNALAMQLQRNYESGQPGLQRAELVAQIDDITRVLDRVAAVQAARRGW